MGCAACAGSGVMVGRRRAFDGSPRRSGGAGCALPSGDCGCGCGGACALPDPAPLGAGEVMQSGGRSSSLAARQDRAALDYQRLMRGAGLTPADAAGDYSDASDAELQRALDAANARGDDHEAARLGQIIANRAEGHTGGTSAAADAAFGRLSEAKRAAIARAAAQNAGADEEQTTRAVTTAISQGLAALNAYLAGEFRVRIAEINAARDITIARLGSEEAVRLRILSNGSTVPGGSGSSSSTTTTTVATVAGVGLLALLLRGAR